MRRVAVVWAVAVGLLAAGLFFGPGSSRADIDPGIKGALTKIADALEKGDSDTAKKLATALAKKVEELDDIMHGFKLRTKKGLGVGTKAGVVVPDGIELKLNSIARDGITAKQLEKEGKNLAEAAWMTAAISEVAVAKAPARDAGKKKKAKWIEWAEGSRDAAKEFAKAVKDNSVTEVKAAAIKINNNCNSCHMIFR